LRERVCFVLVLLVYFVLDVLGEFLDLCWVFVGPGCFFGFGCWAFDVVVYCDVGFVVGDGCPVCWVCFGVVLCSYDCGWWVLYCLSVWGF